MAGDVIGNYRIIGKIGEGGMGAVYLAEHTLLGRQAAIKILLQELSHRSDLVTRFFNEARAATAVKHPGIVEIYDFGYHSDGNAYIVMEYLEGESLSARLRRTGSLSERGAAALCRQVAGALGAAHGKGIVHRDLKPDNIFIVRDSDVPDGERTKILDFGIAKLATGDQAGSGMTRTGTVLGTPAYMAPEQCKGAGNIDHRVDLYALGCILYEMVCGRPPFVAEGAGEVMAQHIYEPVPAPSSIKSVTPALEQLLVRALAKEPDQRFASATEMAAALQTAVPSGSFPRAAWAEETLVARRAGPVPRPIVRTTLGAAASATVTGATQPVKRRRSWIAASVAVAAIAVGGGATLFAVRDTDTDTGIRVVAKPPEPVPATPPAPEPQPPPPAPKSPEPEPEPPPPTPTPLPARIALKLTSKPSGAEVYRMPQGVRIGTTPLDLAMDRLEGEIVLLIKKPGYGDERIAVVADRDSENQVSLTRRPVVTEKPRPRPARDSGTANPPEGTLDPFDKLRSGKPP